MADDGFLPPTLDLTGARLRPLRAADAEALFAHLSDPAVTELTSYPTVTRSLVEAIIARCQERWAAGELSKWAVVLRDADRLVGTCGFNDNSRVHRSAELAYDLAPPFWGQGLMRQAVVAVLRWAYRQDHVDRVQAYVRIDNVRSQGLLERCGFQREGCLRGFRVCRGQAHDFLVYGLLRAEWEKNGITAW